MNLVRLCLLPAVTLIGLGACTLKPRDGVDGDLGESESLLVRDNDDAEEAEDVLEEGIEDALSGSEPTDPGTPADGDADAIEARVKANPGLFFKPAGCITSTRLSPGVWEHAFSACTGPAGRVTYSGKVTSTYALANGSLTITHEATDFEAKGPNVTATVSGARTVEYTRSGSVVTKRRKGTWSGTATRPSEATTGAPFTHEADFTTTWDRASRCITREGSAQNSLDGRAFGRTVTGYKRCGIGALGCPESGTIQLSRNDGGTTLTIELLGGRDAKVTLPSGRSRQVRLLCVER